MEEAPYVETLEPGGSGGSPDGAGGSKLPPVLANLMGSMGAGKSPQGPGGGGINVQEILTSIMVCEPSSSSEPPHAVFRFRLPLFTLVFSVCMFVFVFSIEGGVGFQFCTKASLCSPGWSGTQPVPVPSFSPFSAFQFHVSSSFSWPALS